MARETYDDRDIVRIFRETQAIAVVGASPDPHRHSHRVMHYMRDNGYRIVPINPFAAGEEILGEPVRVSLEDSPGPFELVNVFRRSDAIPGVVDEVIEIQKSKGARFLWMQLDLYDEDAARKARDAGLEVIMDRCLKIEFGRLLVHNG